MSRAKTASVIRDLTSPRNRGILLDVVVFVLNLVLTRMLTGYFVELIRRADVDPLAEFSLGLFFGGMFVLPAAGAVLKRWHYHQRRHFRGGRGGKSEGGSPALGSDPMGSCLFNPIFYLSLSLCISAAAGTLLFDQVFGKDFVNHGGIFVSLVFGSLTLSVVQTILVYRFFSPPKKAPRRAFLRDPRSELFGDVCLYVNMLLFQVIWNAATFVPFGRVASFTEFAGRLFFLCFTALLIYFPPRIFYLADDIHRRTARLTILLANSPVIIRLLVGTSQHL